MNEPGPDDWFDPIAHLAQMPPGSALYGYADDPTDAVQIEFLLRETTPEILRVGPDPEIQIRTGLLDHRVTLPVVLLLRLRPDGPIYPTFWNFHAPVTHPSRLHLFEHMAADGKEVLLKLVGDKGGIERLLPFRHRTQSFFRQATSRIRRAPAWSDADFMEAIDAIHATYPDPVALWTALGPSPL